MTSKLPTITGELRKWRLLQPKVCKTGTVIGYMYDDALDIWEDGENAVIRFRDLVESANFYLAVTNHSCIKLPKDEEVPNVATKGNSDPPKDR